MNLIFDANKKFKMPFGEKKRKLKLGNAHVNEVLKNSNRSLLVAPFNSLTEQNFYRRAERDRHTDRFLMH